MKVVGAYRPETGETTWHAAAALPGNYHTLCGLSLDDDEHEPKTAPRGQKIECAACFAVFTETRRFRVSDFAQHRNGKSAS